MAGHSKWANIKHTKAKQDARRGAVFTKMSREVIVAARSGGADPAANFRLRQAIDKAKASGVPSNMQLIDQADTAQKILKLEDLDDVQRVSSNFELPEALMIELSSLV